MMRGRPRARDDGSDWMFVALALVLFLVLPDPWDVIGGLASLACGVVEITYWQRRMRRVKVETGSST